MTIPLIKHRLRSATYVVLLATFLAVQWSSPHAHLMGAHEHGGDRHQHSGEIHAHQPVAQHHDAIDSGDLGHIDVAGAWVIELDHPPLSSGKPQPNSRTIALVAEIHIPVRAAPGICKLPEDLNLLPDLLPAHIGQPRAPPRLA